VSRRHFIIAVRRVATAFYNRRAACRVSKSAIINCSVTIKMEDLFDEEYFGPLVEFMPTQDDVILTCRDTKLTKHVDEVAKTESDNEIHYGE